MRFSPDSLKKTVSQVTNYFEKCRSKDGNINPGGWGLWFRSFRFLVFHDELTDLEQIWSDHHRTFVEQFVVQGHIFEDAAFKFQTFKGAVSSRFIISPSQVGFASQWDPGSDIESEWEIHETLGVIPVAKVLSFLLDLDIHDAAMHAIKSFPKSLARDLTDHGVIYSTKQFSLHHLDATFDDRVLHLGRHDAETGSALGDADGPKAILRKLHFMASRRVSLRSGCG